MLQLQRGSIAMSIVVLGLAANVLQTTAQLCTLVSFDHFPFRKAQHV